MPVEWELVPIFLVGVGHQKGPLRILTSYWVTMSSHICRVNALPILSEVDVAADKIGRVKPP